MIDRWELWFIIISLAIGSFALRFAFIGIVGNRELPPWLLRHLRYTAVGILPAIIAPAVVWPEATGGALDIPRLAAAFATLSIGLLSKNVIAAILGGITTLYGLQFLLG